MVRLVAYDRRFAWQYSLLTLWEAKVAKLPKLMTTHCAVVQTALETVRLRKSLLRQKVHRKLLKSVRDLRTKQRP